MLRGHELASLGFGGPADLDAGALETLVRDAFQVSGPDASSQTAVRAIALFEAAGETRILRLDLPAAELARQLRISKVLTPVVLGLSLATAVLLLFFSRELVRPLDVMLERARRAGLAERSSADATAELVESFDRALQAWASARGDPTGQLAELLGGEASNGVAMLSVDGALVAVNDSARKLLSVEDQALGEPFDRAFAAHPELVEILHGALEARMGVPRAEFQTVSQGHRISVGLVVDLLRRNSSSSGFLLFLADITESEQRAARVRLADTLTQLGELSAGVAHELRNGIATLSGYLELAQRASDRATTREMLEEAAKEARQLGQVVSDFLGFARPEVRVSQPVDLVELVRDSVEDPALNSASFRIEAPASPALLIGDADLLGRVVRNLLRNAVEATERNGAPEPVDIRIETLTDGYRLRIEDRGPGLPKGPTERLFDPFVSERPGGVGLGLALCRRIVVLHGGAIYLASREGGGAVATVELPLRNNVTVGSA